MRRLILSFVTLLAMNGCGGPSFEEHYNCDGIETREYTKQCIESRFETVKNDYREYYKYNALLRREYKSWSECWREHEPKANAQVRKDCKEATEVALCPLEGFVYYYKEGFAIENHLLWKEDCKTTDVPLARDVCDRWGNTKDYFISKYTGESNTETSELTGESNAEGLGLVGTFVTIFLTVLVALLIINLDKLYFFANRCRFAICDFIDYIDSIKLSDIYVTRNHCLTHHKNDLDESIDRPGEGRYWCNICHKQRIGKPTEYVNPKKPDEYRRDIFDD